MAVRCLPGLVLAVLAAVLLMRHAPEGTVARYTAYTAFGVTLPGLVLYRVLSRRRANLLEDLAAGFVVGTAALILCYLAAAAAGLQRWAALWAVPVLVAAVAVPGWRRRVWARVEQPLRPVTGWLAGLGCAIPLVVVHQHGPEQFTPAFTDPRINYFDMPFHTALAASARHDVPLQAPWVDGEPMKYHYFFHQLVAATSWATGVDLTNLVFGLLWLPLVLVSSALVFVLADRIAPRSIWFGPLAMVIAAVGGTVQPYAEVALAADMTTTSAYLSPTQNLGVALALLLVIVAGDILTADRAGGLWILLGLLVLAASGSKATILPLAVCGFGLVVLVRLLGRRLAGRALVGAAVAVVVLGLSIVVVYGGESSGTVVEAGRAFARLAPYQQLRATTGAEIDTKAQLATAIVTVLAWSVATAGLVVFLRSRTLWRDPRVVFLAGFAIAGLAATVLTDQPGNSQMYFHRTAMPVVAVLACAGLWRLVVRLGDPAAPALVGIAGVAGLGACLVARVVADDAIARDAASVALPWIVTGAALLAAAVVVTLVWKAARPVSPIGYAGAVALISAAMTGATLVPLMSVFTGSGAAGTIFALPFAGGPDRTEAAAARWLRANSDTDDLVATNAHCAARPRGACDTRHFWIAALTERHVLVEGWAYTNTINGIVAGTGRNPSLEPFWDQPRLVANDAVFERPSAGTVGVLRNRYGVRWLYADTTSTPVPRSLGRFAVLRYDRPGVRIYELR